MLLGDCCTLVEGIILHHHFKTKNMKIYILLISIVMLISSCTKDKVIDPVAILSISDISNVDVTTANYTGTISSDGGFLITERGVCWNEGVIPTISDNKTIIGEGAGTFNGKLTGLKPNTKYYLRAFATNQAGTVYGSFISFTTQDGAIDVEGNVYHAVKIGSQTWLVENLRTTKYNDGSQIDLISNGGSWQRATAGAYCWYTIDGTIEATNGALYNWNAVNSGKLCPFGWHVPSDAEWKTLSVYLQNNGYNFNGYVDTDVHDSTNNYVAKSLASQTGWLLTSNIGAVGNTDYPSYRNKSGFNAFPAGMRPETGDYNGLNAITYWWSSTELWTKYAWRRGIDYLNYSLLKSYDLKNTGLSVRCIKN